MQRPLQLTTAIIIIIAETTNLTFGSSALIEQVVNAQNMTENNNTDDNSTNESGTISSLPMPIRHEIMKGAEFIGHEIKENTELAEHESGIHDVKKDAKSVFNKMKNAL